MGVGRGQEKRVQPGGGALGARAAPSFFLLDRERLLDVGTAFEQGLHDVDLSLTHGEQHRRPPLVRASRDVGTM